jgi:hypothetical protein
MQNLINHLRCISDTPHGPLSREFIVAYKNHCQELIEISLYNTLHEYRMHYPDVTMYDFQATRLTNMQRANLDMMSKLCLALL